MLISGAPPQPCRRSAKFRISVSVGSSRTSETRIVLEYFRREAKKRILRIVPSRYSTSTGPKSCWLNSPGKPSKRTSGASGIPTALAPCA